MNNNKSIQAILKSYKVIGGANHTEGLNLPSRQSVHYILDLIRTILFPGFFEPLTGHLENIITQKVLELQEKLTLEITKSLMAESAIHKDQAQQKAEDISARFINQIPSIRRILKTDIQATFDGDPAAKSEQEIILSYPGFQAISVFRTAHFFYQENVPLIPRIMTEIAHSETGIDINPGATIGERFCIDHGTGIVIGETSHIGNNVKLYQGVTLGALSVQKSSAQTKRHPTIEDNVTVYAHATILGGDTIIGEGSTIGGNIWLIQSIPAHSKTYISTAQQKVTVRKSNS
ncbi:MAG: serine acetyltransferase [Candidatus Margulisbacteria bacterium]|nr:serine acetyltransferase [Candidatus Margulisiibacteriota bacterium]